MCMNWLITDGWVGIVRICYQLGSLNGINETNGCKNWTNAMLGYTAYYCFCDTDYCNSAVTMPRLNIIPILLLLYALILWIHHTQQHGNKVRPQNKIRTLNIQEIVVPVWYLVGFTKKIIYALEIPLRWYLREKI